MFFAPLNPIRGYKWLRGRAIKGHDNANCQDKVTLSKLSISEEKIHYENRAFHCFCGFCKFKASTVGVLAYPLRAILARFKFRKIANSPPYFALIGKNPKK